MSQTSTVHILVEDTEQPYAGYLTCRPFCRGEDAAAVVGVLGLSPAAMGVTRL